MIRPRKLVCSTGFRVVFVLLVFNSALFLASCFCSFFLSVRRYLICVFIVFSQLVLLSNLPKFPHSFCVSSRMISIVFILFSKGPNFSSMQNWGHPVYCIFYSWIFLGKALLKIWKEFVVIVKILPVFVEYLFRFLSKPYNRNNKIL